MREELTELQSKALGVVRSRRAGAPVTGTEIANAIGLAPRANGKAGADMRAVINALRVKGWPICASGEGYWWPANSAELAAYIASFEGRIRDQQRALDGLRDGFDKIDDTVEPDPSPYAVPPPTAPVKTPADPSLAGAYVIERKWPEESSYFLLSAEDAPAFLAANPAAKKY